jgi:hypothetical protein
MRKLFFILCLFLTLVPDSDSTAEEFVLGAYRAQSLIGEARLVDGTDYVSFTGDFGFTGWLPTTEVIERHLAHESRLLSNFRLSVINQEYMLSGISGRELDRQIDAVAIAMLEKAGFDVISRANNHALDHGRAGVHYNTTQWAKVGLATIGTRDSPVYEWETGGRRIAIFALTDYTDREDQERLILRIDEADLALIRQKTGQADFRIAFIHLGSMGFFPSPHERKQVGRLLDAGADLVVCTGSHFIKGFVTERGKPVVYGIGNHLFSSVDRNTEPFGMHLVAGFRSGEFVQLFAIPFRNTILEGNTGPLDEAASTTFMKTFLERSTTDTARYFSDPRSLTMLKENISRFNLTSFSQIRPRHFVYALLITYQHYPMIVITGSIAVLTLLVLLICRGVLVRR